MTAERESITDLLERLDRMRDEFANCPCRDCLTTPKFFPMAVREAYPRLREWIRTLERETETLREDILQLEREAGIIQAKFEAAESTINEFIYKESHGEVKP